MDISKGATVKDKTTGRTGTIVDIEESGKDKQTVIVAKDANGHNFHIAEKNVVQEVKQNNTSASSEEEAN